jgi:hypothetical protein
MFSLVVQLLLFGLRCAPTVGIMVDMLVDMLVEMMVTELQP